jgi:5'-nucleotidase (lipoprotein e(P4) family)
MKIKDILTFVSLIIVFVLFGCKTKYEQAEENRNNDHLINAVLYQQTAAEYKALCYQAFNIGILRLKKDISFDSIVKPRAVVVDIDETMLDNSPYEAKCINENTSYPEFWHEWINQANAKAVPGALDFVYHADSLGYSIFYVTNRKVKYLDQTIRNLRERGFPQVDESHLMMRTDESSKESRRQKILENYHISLLVGDNIHDFTNLFEGKSISQRSEITDSLKQEFGKRFIVLPNAMYGSWDPVLFLEDKDLTKEKKDLIRLENLKGF